MTTNEQKREFLQETAFEEDVNLESPYKTEEQKQKMAQKFAQWLEKDKK